MLMNGFPIQLCPVPVGGQGILSARSGTVRYSYSLSQKLGLLNFHGTRKATVAEETFTDRSHTRKSSLLLAVRYKWHLRAHKQGEVGELHANAKLTISAFPASSLGGSTCKSTTNGPLARDSGIGLSTLFFLPGEKWEGKKQPPRPCLSNPKQLPNKKCP